MARPTDDSYPNWMTPFWPISVEPETRRSCWRTCMVLGCIYLLAQPSVAHIFQPDQVSPLLSLFETVERIRICVYFTSGSVLWVTLICLVWLQLEEAPKSVQLFYGIGWFLTYFAIAFLALALLVLFGFLEFFEQFFVFLFAAFTLLWGIGWLLRNGLLTTNPLFSALTNGRLSWRLGLAGLVATVYSVFYLYRIFFS